nr:NADH dehydrogenase subunit 5 [Habroloma sp.]
MISICLIYSLLFLLFSIAFFISGLLFLINDLVYFIEVELFSLNSNCIVMSMLFDWMSLFFMSFVMFISSMVIYYSIDYMMGDKNLNRFIMLVGLFVFSMMLLIISPNMISILLGWDGLGLVSYCLVIYYQNVKSANAGMLTALSNRVGDVAILMSIAWMLNYGSWNFVYYLDFMKNDYFMQLIAFFVVLAAMTKSAQIPFSSWLPAAMAAPTPVSSLVHSSTLVTAGVYLIIRFFNGLNSSLLMILLLISCLTMFMSGLGANFEYDLKKIIALSTLSQLGLMMSIISLGNPYLGFFHLLTHALFKALLFMCAGCFIHNLMNCQDIRFMGGLSYSMPLVSVFFNISNLSLCGIPFLSGFYSKDLILEFMSMNYLNVFIYLLYYISTGLTVSYSMRLLYYSLIGSFNFFSLNNLSHEGSFMLKGMIGLVFLVIFGGSMLMWCFLTFPYFICLSFLMKLMTLLCIFLGSWLGYSFSQIYLSSNFFSYNYIYISFFISLMWNLPYISTVGINYFTLVLSNYYYKTVDQGWLEYYGSQGIFKLISNSSSSFQSISINNFKVFLFLVVILLLTIFVVF